MAHFAELDKNNKVLRVIVVNNKDILDENGNESESKGITFCKKLLGDDTKWIQTSYNNKIRKKYAGIGFFYNADEDAFIAPQPFPSWSLDEKTFNWKSPIDYPSTGLNYYWVESSKSWERVYIEFIPTPNSVIEEIIKYISPSDKFYDLGCGDGRVLTAALKITSNVKGVDIDPKIIETTKDNVRDYISLGDLLDFDISDATVIYMYIEQQTNDVIASKFKKLKPGTKIISYIFGLSDWEPTFTHVIDDIPFFVWIV